jgi:hypothetical protein
MLGYTRMTLHPHRNFDRMDQPTPYGNRADQRKGRQEWKSKGRTSKDKDVRQRAARDKSKRSKASRKLARRNKH